ncbi:hypothetical protein [Rhodopirellula europaea]|uniref:hypothetical protein n=1 Tax=Rhodopirellula europaea TaxID=1263866 RepID=UPI003D2797AA
MKPATITLVVLVASCLFTTHGWSQSAPTKQQLEKWHKQFPAADTNRDGTLSPKEATAYRKKLLGRRGKQSNINRATRGAPRQFKVDARWDQPRFPDEAVCYKTPAEIKAIYEDVKPANQNTVVSFPEPTGRERRIVATGHSFMAPGFNTLPKICKAAGIQPMLYTHTGGGITGSARYKWEQENGIFQFEGSPVPKLLASISNADWDAMMFGPYFNDKPEYYSCWIDFCLKFNPDMKFYLSDAWPQLYQLGENPTSESFFTEEVFERLGDGTPNDVKRSRRRPSKEIPGQSLRASDLRRDGACRPSLPTRRPAGNRRRPPSDRRKATVTLEGSTRAPRPRFRTTGRLRVLCHALRRVSRTDQDPHRIRWRCHFPKRGAGSDVSQDRLASRHGTSVLGREG